MEFRRENSGFWLRGGTSAAMVAQLQWEAAEYGLSARNRPVSLRLGTAFPSCWVKQQRAERASPPQAVQGEDSYPALTFPLHSL